MTAPLTAWSTCQTLVRSGLLAAISLVAAATAFSAGVTDTPFEVGRRIFREGRLSSGEPLSALVAGDVPVSGTQFSCQSCHGRSGMGAGEGEIRVPPVSSLLFEPSPQRRRGAYDTASLGRAVVDGEDPSGRALDPLMPRYRLPPPDLEALVVYLRGLSAAPSPGVTEKEIRFATVITQDVPSTMRRAVLDVLERYVDEKNRQTRLESRRPGHGAPPGQTLPTTYREWALDVWDLSGPSETWSEQLQQRYRAAPVFAMLGGLSDGSWAPIARFCERNELPCLLPGTDFPDGRDGDFYTLYFSRGLFLEADLIASDLAGAGLTSVVQVVLEDGAARAAADQLSATLGAQGTQTEVVSFAAGGIRALLEGRLSARRDTAVVLWLTRRDLASLKKWPPASRVYVSSTLLDGNLDGVAAGSRQEVLAAHPFVLPGPPDPARLRFRAWLHARRIAMTHERQQAEAYFACLAATDGVRHAGRFLVRDYLLDTLDHAQGLSAYLPFHPRPGTGPGQRHLSKGGFVVPVRNGVAQVERARWIVP